LGPSGRTIIELNIDYYKNLLKTETNASKRQTIFKLLAEEEAKLAELLRPWAHPLCVRRRGKRGVHLSLFDHAELQFSVE